VILAPRWSLLLPRLVQAGLLLLLTPAAGAQDKVIQGVGMPDTGTIPSGVQVVLDGHKVADDAYTLYVQEVGSATPLLAVNAGLPLNPASTMKTLTTLAALEVLGPNYTWYTEIHALGTITDGTLEGDLLIKGGADPFLVEEYFRNMLKALHRRGVQRISGDLLIDASLFDPSVSAQPLIDNDSNRSYNVLPHALAVNFQTVNFYFYPHQNGRDVVVAADPVLPNLQIDNQLRLQQSACTGFQRGVAFREDAARSTVIFSGQYPARCSEYSLARTVLDAPNYAFGLFRKLWAEIGGEFAGGLRLELAPAEREPLVTWASPPLGDVIKSINKYSNNMMTRQLLLTLAFERFGKPATVENGILAVREYLDSHGIDHSTMVMVNGAGLGRQVRLTSAMLNQVLQRGHTISLMPEFVASLPVGGIDGTMRNRRLTGGAQGNMHIKTGSLDGVAAIAGYVHARSGKDYVVIAMLNQPQADTGPGQELGDALLSWVYQQ